MSMTYKFNVMRGQESDARLVSRLNESLQDTRDSDHLTSVIHYETERAEDSRTEIKADIDPLESLFPNGVPDLVLDLVELAAATYSIDKEVKREIRIDNETGKGRVETRNIKIQFPVLSSQLDSDKAETLVSTMISHSTRDIFEFEFLVENVSDSPLPNNNQTASVDAISLLSDGLDSTAGIYYNRKNNIDSSYVSVNYGSSIRPTVELIVEETGIDHEIHRIDLQKSGNEFTQFSRGFLHLTFGLINALATDAKNVYSFENGIVARFDVLQEGWLTTRTVTPFLLTHYNAFIDEILDRDITVSNPFSHKSKTEIVEYIPDTDLVRQTVSCPHTSKYNYAEYDNCNLCVPCIFRAIALVNSNHEISFDELGVFNSFSTADFESLTFPKGGQVERKYQEALEKSIGRLNREANSPETYLEAMAELAYFSQLILSENKSTVVREYPRLHSEKSFELHRRFAENYIAAMKQFEQTNPSIQALTL